MAKPEDRKTCIECGEAINGVHVSWGSMPGSMHYHTYCWQRKNPPKTATTIEDVVNSGDDPCLARYILISYLSDSSIAKPIIKEYNERMAEIYRKRCAE